MDTGALTAVLSLVGTIVGSLGGIVISSKLTNYRIEQLERRVAEHNNFAHRMPVVEEQISVINRRISDLERDEHEKCNH